MRRPYWFYCKGCECEIFMDENGVDHHKYNCPERAAQEQRQARSADALADMLQKGAHNV